MPGSLLGLPLVVPSGSLAASLAVFNAALEATASLERGEATPGTRARGRCTGPVCAVARLH